MPGSLGRRTTRTEYCWRDLRCCAGILVGKCALLLRGRRPRSRFLISGAEPRIVVGSEKPNEAQLRTHLIADTIPV